MEIYKVIATRTNLNTGHSATLSTEGLTLSEVHQLQALKMSDCRADSISTLDQDTCPIPNCPEYVAYQAIVKDEPIIVTFMYYNINKN